MDFLLLQSDYIVLHVHLLVMFLPLSVCDAAIVIPQSLYHSQRYEYNSWSPQC